MVARSRCRLLTAFVACVAIGARGANDRSASASPLPDRLTGREFTRLIDEMSEPSDLAGNDNLVSNELRYQTVIPELARIAPPGRAYIGVGPEQNFTYISVLRPAIAFIVDIRRGNLHLHLLYKAIFELAADRVEFVSLLFSRPRPWRLGARSTVKEIFTAYRPFFQNDRLSADTAAAIRRQLVVKDGLALSDGDLQGVEDI